MFVLYSDLLLLISALEIAGCTLPNLLISLCGSFGMLRFLFFFFFFFVVVVVV